MPIFNWRTYAPFREELKNEFNERIRSNYQCIDFENEIGQNIDGIWKFKDDCDSGDHLHPSKYAYKLMGKLASKKVLE